MMLTKKNFPTFVDTFNYMLGRIDNIKGDKDINPQNGVISVDNTDPDHPVIRCDVNKIPNVNGEKLVGDSDLDNASTYSVHVGKRSAEDGGETYATLYNFDQTPSESATATLDNNQGQYDVGSGDWFLVKNGNELKYKKITIETDLPSSGGGGGGGGGAFSYDPDTHTIKDGMYLRARRWVDVSSATVSAAGYAYLQIGMGTSGTASIVTGASSIPTANNTYMYVPLYQFNTDLKVIHDYRGAPTAQMWEF